MLKHWGILCCLLGLVAGARAASPVHCVTKLDFAVISGSNTEPYLASRPIAVATSLLAVPSAEVTLPAHLGVRAEVPCGVGSPWRSEMPEQLLLPGDVSGEIHWESTAMSPAHPLRLVLGLGRDAGGSRCLLGGADVPATLYRAGVTLTSQLQTLYAVDFTYQDRANGGKVWSMNLLQTQGQDPNSAAEIKGICFTGYTGPRQLLEGNVVQVYLRNNRRFEFIIPIPTSLAVGYELDRRRLVLGISFGSFPLTRAPLLPTGTRRRGR